MSELEPTRTYSNPTATEILRRMLDERGVEWMPVAWNPKRETFYHAANGVGFCADEYTDGVKIYTDATITPAQAIAATLGAGSCKRVMDSIDPFAMWVCDHCGHPLDTSENFCGGCGRKVVTNG